MEPPTHSCQVLTTDLNRAFVKQWVLRHSTARPKKCLLLVGPSGVGKSILAELCLRESAYDIVTVAADTYKNKRLLDQALRDTLHIPLKQAVVVEDPQVLVADGGLQALVQFCKQGTRVPVVVVCCRTKRAKVQQLLAHADQVNFSALPCKTLAKHFNILPSQCCGGDLRQICVNKGVVVGSAKDANLDVQEAATSLLEGQPVHRGLRMYRVDRQALENITHANYCDVVKDMGTAALVARDLSDADTIRGEDMAADVAGIVGCVTPGNRIRLSPKTLKPDLLWTKASFRQTRLRNLASARSVFASSGTVLDHYSLPLVRQRMLQAALAGDYRSVQTWAPDASLQQLTNVMRMSLAKNDALVNRFRRSFKRQVGLLPGEAERF